MVPKLLLGYSEEFDVNSGLGEEKQEKKLKIQGKGKLRISVGPG